MSMRRTDLGETYEVYTGTTKELEATIINPDSGNAQDLSDTNVYTTGIAIIYKPDGTQIGGNMAISFDTPRSTGITFFTVLATHSHILNAGNWIGLIQFFNVGGDIIDQQVFNINIKETR